MGLMPVYVEASQNYTQDTIGRQIGREKESYKKAWVPEFYSMWSTVHKGACHAIISVIWSLTRAFFLFLCLLLQQLASNTNLCYGCPHNYEETSITLWNCSGTRSKGAWIAPGLPSWPQAAIWSSPLLSRMKTVQPPSAKRFRNSTILSSLVGLNWEPLWGLNEMRLILHGIPWTRSASLFASSLLQKVFNAVLNKKHKQINIHILLLEIPMLLRHIMILNFDFH